jgi:hypothetical protein
MRKIYDPFRGLWVVATPEELVRQNWLRIMMEQLQYPQELLVVEKELKMLPHLQECHYCLPKRRIDILIFSRGQEPITPLLLIECKSGFLSNEAMSQAQAYNTFVQARYVAIVNKNQVRLQREEEEIDFLPLFHDL